MKKSPLFQLIQSFSVIETREVVKFLHSPFFNTRQDLIQLFEYLKGQEVPQKEEAWAFVYQNEKTYSHQKCRLLMSYLHKLLEEYVVVKETQKEELNNRLRLVRAYRRKGLIPAFERASKAFAKKLEQNPLRDASFMGLKYDHLLEHYWNAIRKDPTNATYLGPMKQALDAQYLSTRLRLICLSIAQRGVYATGKAAQTDDDVLKLARKKEWASVSTVSIYLHCFDMLSQPEEEAHFQLFKQDLLLLRQQFSGDEMKGLYLMAINYCIRQLNEGDGSYHKEVLDLYRPGIENGYLLEGNILSRFTYHNVVAAGIRAGELEWVRSFLYAYKAALQKRYRESSFSFNLARLEYEEKRFDPVLDLLQKANYADPLLNLSAKTLLLKTYYELVEYDLMQSHLDAMRNYIRRKKVIGYHRKNYLNIVRYAEKLLRVNVLDKEAVARLRMTIQEEEVLTEKEWLMACLS